jgi:hypothetical protein
VGFVSFYCCAPCYLAQELEFVEEERLKAALELELSMPPQQPSALASRSARFAAETGAEKSSFAPTTPAHRSSASTVYVNSPLTPHGRPTGGPWPMAPVVPQEGWVAVVSKTSGETYFQHLTTGETRWDPPPALQANFSQPGRV